jgi:hypothetical protein
LKVGIHYNDRITIGMGQPGAHRSLMAKIARQKHCFDPRIAPGEVRRHFRCPIAAAIVHEDQLQAEIPASEYVHQPPVGKQDYILFIEAWNYNGQ